MPRASRNGVSLHYEHVSDTDGDGEPVVFVQNLGVGRWSWRWQREALGDARTVIAPDTRGTGRSEAGLPLLVGSLPARLRRPLLSRLAGYSVTGLTTDLEAVLADGAVRNVHLVGAGLGGMIALEHALEYGRAESLTLLSTSPGGEAGSIDANALEAAISADGATERQRSRERMRPLWTDRFCNRNPHLLDRIVEWRLEQDAGAPAREAQAAAMTGFDASDRLGALRVPTLVCHGTADRLVPVENAHLLAEAIPNSRLELIEGGSHAIAIEAADRVNERLLAFLETSG